MQYIVSQNLREKISWKICTENPWTSLKILADLQLSLRSSGTIFTDPEGKKAHSSVQILKESSTWAVSVWVTEIKLESYRMTLSFFCWMNNQW